MKTISIKITTKNFESDNEILLALLSDLNFEGFLEDHNFLIGYLKENEFENFKLFFETIKNNFDDLTYTTEIIEEKNWNELWEKNFDPVIISNTVLIKAPFHQIDKKYKYEITIFPRMAFGTGHHPTTAMMIELMLKYHDRIINKKVVDIGCGTGILAIMASKLGAQDIVAIDISSYAIENTTENAKLNNINNINCYESSIEFLNFEKFDIILANLTKNLILEQINYYYNLLSYNGLIFLSGILSIDINEIINKMTKYNFKFLEKSEKKEWCGIVFLKN